MGLRHTSPTRPITPDEPHHRHSFLKPMWMQKLHSMFARDESRSSSPVPVADGVDGIPQLSTFAALKSPPKQEKDKDAPSRPIDVRLPRQATFRRQNSEKRERLCPAEPHPDERRAMSASRHVSTSSVRRRARSSPPPTTPCSESMPTVATVFDAAQQEVDPVAIYAPSTEASQTTRVHTDSVFDYEERSPRPLSRTSSRSSFNNDNDHDDEQCLDDDRDQLRAELDTRWILNLSMHFRDKSDREKFFVTYAETPTKWRRVTVSCDYRNCELGSLEQDLKELQFQRDKSFQIYEAIRDSLPDIQFYETVTNLKLETSEGRLHVHVTEDVNEIIPYPPRSMVRHILDDEDLIARPMEICEKDIAFDAHLSGFVYRVWHENRIYIKKEIPSPDTIDEFLYEINALHALHNSGNVIKLEAIVLDDTKHVVKGLLISFAEQGAVVDILYDHKGQVPWAHRERWARQAVMGLRDVHEEGYVQGDFTLSNMVVDHENNAKIIDINRRGCPVGWEPPEIAQKIASNQRISMYIGEKSDLYQLGMTLWALAMDDDEPERHDPPLSTHEFPSEIPEWFQDIVRICLSERPRDRLPAKELVERFPTTIESDMDTAHLAESPPRPHSLRRTEKQYINPEAAVERDDIERFKKDEEELVHSPQSSKDDWTFTYPQSSGYDVESFSSAFEGHRGRKLATNAEHTSNEEQLAQRLPSSHAERHIMEMNPEVVCISPNQKPEYHESEINRRSYLGSNSTLSASELCILDDSQPRQLDTMQLAPTTLAQSSSPFRFSSWQRSLSESTPRNSRIRVPSQLKDNTAHVSPRSSSTTGVDRGARTETSPMLQSTKSCRSSNETIPTCDISIDETTLSGTTWYSQHSEQNFLRHKLSDTQILSKDTQDKQINPSEEGIISEQNTLMTIPSMPIHDSGYDEPTLREMTKT